MFFKNAQIKFVISWSCHLKSCNLRGMALEGMAWFVSIATAPVWYCVWQQTLSLSHSALCAPQHGFLISHQSIQWPQTDLFWATSPEFNCPWQWSRALSWPGLASPLRAFQHGAVTRKRRPQAHRGVVVFIQLCQIKPTDPPQPPLTSPKNSPWLSRALVDWEWQLSWQQQYALKCQVKSFHCLSE